MIMDLDYLLTLSKTQIGRLERIQTEAMRAVLGCTRDTPIACLRHILGLPSIAVRHKMAQAKMYLRVMDMEEHPLHPVLHAVRGTRIKRGQSWMAQAEESIKKVCSLDNITEGKEWLLLANEIAPDFTKVIIGVKKSDARDVAGSAETAVRQIIEDNSRPSDPVIYTDGSVQRGVKSGWGFAVLRDGHVIHKASGACNITTSSTHMEIEAVTKALKWMQTNMPQATKHVIIVTDSQNILKRVEKGTLRKEWIASFEAIALKKVTWVYSPSHTGVAGNEMADALASNALVNSQVQMDKADTLRALECLLVEEEMEEEAVMVTGLVEHGVQRGSGRKSQSTGSARRITNQMNTGTISKKTLRWILERGTEQLWLCPDCDDVVPQDK